MWVRQSDSAVLCPARVCATVAWLPFSGIRGCPRGVVGDGSSIIFINVIPETRRVCVSTEVPM